MSVDYLPPTWCLGQFDVAETWTLEHLVQETARFGVDVCEGQDLGGDLLPVPFIHHQLLVGNFIRRESVL